MNDPSYLPGSWFAVVSPRAVVLLEDAVSPSRLQSVWDACNGEPSLDDLIEVVTGGRFVGAPFFGIGLLDDTGLRVVVRAGVTAVVGESIGAARSIVGGHTNTWVEEILDEPQSLRLFRDAASSPTLALPVKGGIVYADEITWTPSSSLIVRDSTTTRSQVAPLVLVDPPVQEDLVSVAPVTDSDDSEWSVWQLNEAGELAGSGRGGESREQSELDAHLGQELGAHLGEAPVETGYDRPPLLPEDQPPSLLESRPPHPIEGYLHFSTGQIVPLDRAVIVGRAPSVDYAQRPDLSRSVRIDNLDQDISRNHVEVRLEDGQALVVDLNSANGTMVTIPGQAPQRLTPEEPLRLAIGSIVALSEEISFSYQVSQ